MKARKGPNTFAPQSTTNEYKPCVQQIVLFPGTAVGKLLTLGGVGIWWIVDVILLVTGDLRPADDSNWVPYYWTSDSSFCIEQRWENWIPSGCEEKMVQTWCVASCQEICRHRRVGDMTPDEEWIGRLILVLKRVSSESMNSAGTLLQRVASVPKRFSDLWTSRFGRVWLASVKIPGENCAEPSRWFVEVTRDFVFSSSGEVGYFVLPSCASFSARKCGHCRRCCATSPTLLSPSSAHFTISVQFKSVGGKQDRSSTPHGFQSRWLTSLFRYIFAIKGEKIVLVIQVFLFQQSTSDRYIAAVPCRNLNHLQRLTPDPKRSQHFTKPNQNTRGFQTGFKIRFKQKSEFHRVKNKREWTALSNKQKGSKNTSEEKPYDFSASDQPLAHTNQTNQEHFISMTVNVYRNVHDDLVRKWWVKNKTEEKMVFCITSLRLYSKHSWGHSTIIGIQSSTFTGSGSCKFSCLETRLYSCCFHSHLDCQNSRLLSKDWQRKTKTPWQQRDTDRLRFRHVTTNFSIGRAFWGQTSPTNHKILQSLRPSHPHPKRKGNCHCRKYRTHDTAAVEFQFNEFQDVTAVQRRQVWPICTSCCVLH